MKTSFSSWKTLLPAALLVFGAAVLAMAAVSGNGGQILRFTRTNTAETGSVSGTVTTSATGVPLPAVTITLQSEDGNFKEKAVTDNRGRFHFSGLTPGRFELQAKKKGYKPLTGHTFWVTSGSDTPVSLQMEPLKTAPEKDLLHAEPECRIAGVAVTRSTAAEQKMMKYCSGAAGMPVSVADESYYQEFNTESYDKISENAFRDVKGNPLSTFSVDVDRASYSNVRRFLQNNTLPYKDAVRIEELINYFDYDYPQPSNGVPFSVSMEMGSCPWNPAHRLVLIGLKGKEMEADQIPAGNLVFLIDVSGSMSDENKLPLLKKAFRILVDNLRPSDRVAMVVYAGAAGVVLESTPGNDKQKILSALDNLEAGGSTAGGAGISLAYKIARQHYIQGGNNRVILATDGDFNIGSSSDAEMERLIEEKRKEGVFLTVLGFGMGNYKDSKMEKIADAGNGNYAYIDNILEAKKMFGEELWGTLFTIAKDVKIQVEFNPEKVMAYRLIGYENRILNKEDFNDDRKDAGEIGCGHTVTALYEIVPAGSGEKIPVSDPLEYQNSRVTGSPNMMTVKLRYKEPDDTVSKLVITRLTERDLNAGSPSQNLRFASAVAEFGMLLRASEHRGNATWDHVIASATEARGADRHGYRQDFIRMAQTAALLSK